MTADVTPKPDLAQEIVLRSLDHLSAIVLPNGRFIYAHDADEVLLVYEGYNLLRHCGTLWFMARAARECAGSVDLHMLRSIVGVAGYIGQKLETAPWAAPDRPSLALVGNGAVKLGGLGLGLLALSETSKLPDILPMLEAALPMGVKETISRMRQYALDEIEGDDFRHKRAFPSGEILPFRSDYYTGEAIFGLLTTGPVTAELTEVVTALMRRGYGFAEQSHWMAYAACEAIERSVVPEVLGATYLAGLMEAILGDTSYRLRRQSTPIACRTEALTRVLLLHERMPNLLHPELPGRIRAEAGANLLLQLDWYANGQFWKGDNARKVQIDYIQHNATAFLQWLHLARAC